MESVENLLESIQNLYQEVMDGEKANIDRVLNLSRILVELKNQAPRTWLKRVEQIGLNQRVARRYLTIGENWSIDRTPESDLLKSMPYDLLKLEWLCRLPMDDLKQLARTMDFRVESRGRVIEAVKRLLGQPSTQKEVVSEPLQPLLDKWNNSIEHLLDGIESLNLSQREQLARELEAKYTALRQALQPVA
jgi:hypothetical protein